MDMRRDRSTVLKRKETLLKKYGSEEAVRDYYRRIGSLASHPGTGGFASNKVGKDGLTGPQRAALVGAIGGFKSRRGPAKKKEEK